MSLSRFFVEPEQILENEIRILGSDMNHMKNVLRLRNGEKLEVSDRTMLYTCEVEAYTEDAAIVRILSSEAGSHELTSKLYLFQGLPKGDKMELITQKCVELGGFEIIPVETKRSIVKLDEKKKEARVNRLQAVSEAAAKQSGRDIVPAVHDVLGFKAALDYAFSVCDHVLIPYENADNMAETKTVIEGINMGESVGIFVGPEGGFEEAEVEAVCLRGGHPVTLGKRILRTETAGFMLLSVLMFRLEK